jgi:hypothetical protein
VLGDETEFFKKISSFLEHSQATEPATKPAIEPTIEAAAKVNEAWAVYIRSSKRDN